MTQALFEFACMAEAIAFFYKQGYHRELDETDRATMMKPGSDDIVDIRKQGFLYVVARINQQGT